MKKVAPHLLETVAKAQPLQSSDEAYFSNTTPPQILQRVQPDGNCFFRCISFLLTHSETYHIEMRNLIVMSIKQNHIFDNIPVTQYLINSQMHKLGIWATQVEICAAASMLDTDIYTYTLNTATNKYQWLRYPATTSLLSPISTSSAIYLQHTNNNHYDVVFGLS